MKKIILCILFVVTIFTSCGISNEEISNTVKSSMQDKFDTDTQFKEYNLQVLDVIVIKQSDNIYKGIAKLSYESSSYDVPVDITVDSKNVLWQIAPNSFSFIANKKIQNLQNIFR